MLIDRSASHSVIKAERKYVATVRPLSRRTAALSGAAFSRPLERVVRHRSNDMHRVYGGYK
jgi:hypothetical protein